MADAIRPFHLAFPGDDFAAARGFYGGSRASSRRCFHDPRGNALEFKAFADDAMTFAT
ncbi:MAG TPA: hypothetical protein VM657_01685 [Sphingomonas sp.]|nr:hypothetical protein [Sphingomonas sp.]